MEEIKLTHCGKLLIKIDRYVLGFMKRHNMTFKELYVIEDSIPVKDAKTATIKGTMCESTATFLYSKVGNVETTNSKLHYIPKKLDTEIFNRIKHLKDYQAHMKKKESNKKEKN